MNITMNTMKNGNYEYWSTFLKIVNELFKREMSHWRIINYLRKKHKLTYDEIG